MRRTVLLTATLCSLGAPALADAPAVATDIAPVHSLVAQVMQGVAEPALILPPGASPHGYAMRPSEAAALAEAELVVWIGPRLTPWLADAVGTLADDAAKLELLDVDGTVLLDVREGPTFEEHRHADADAHAEAHAGHAGSGLDPHAWLDPRNAGVWLGAIADALAGIDPENAARYRANAAVAKAGIDALTAGVNEVVAPVRDEPFIVFHDAFHYFENRFGIAAAGAIAEGDAAPAGPARISAIRDLIVRTGAACVFAEPQLPHGVAETVTEGTKARIGVLDPLGAGLAAGPGLYGRMLREIGVGLRDCLAAGG